VNHGWAVFILPYIEQKDLAAMYRFDKDWSDAVNAPVTSTMVKTFICPSVPAGPNRKSIGADGRLSTVAMGDYGVDNAINDGLRDNGGTGVIDNIGPAGSSAYFGVMRGNRVVKITQITDGASNTLVIGEDAGRPQRYFRNKMASTTVSGGGWADRDNEYITHGWQFDTDTSVGPCAVNCSNDNELYSFHNGGCTIALADGSARFLGDNVAIRMVGRLITMNGGETFKIDF
jgi:prepilin-type processing-associated H-X9-DG protein